MGRRRAVRAKVSPLLDRRRSNRFHLAVLALKDIVDDFQRGRLHDLGPSSEAKGLQQGMVEEAAANLEALKNPRTGAKRRKRIVDDVCDAHHVLMYGAVYGGAKA